MSVDACRTVWDCADLKHGELLVMLALADAANEDMECWPSMKTIMLKSRMQSKSSVAEIVRKLIEKGYIKRKRRYINGEYTTSMYKITIKKTDGIIWKEQIIRSEDKYPEEIEDAPEENYETDSVLLEETLPSVPQDTTLVSSGTPPWCPEGHLNRPLNRPLNRSLTREEKISNAECQLGDGLLSLGGESVNNKTQEETPEQYAIRVSTQQRDEILKARERDLGIPVSEIPDNVSAVEAHRQRVLKAVDGYLNKSIQDGYSPDIEDFVGKIPENIRANAREFCRLFGRAPIKSERSFWIKSLSTQLELGIGVEDIRDAFQEMRNKGLYVKSPASVTAIAETYKRSKAERPYYGMAEVYMGDGTRLV